MLFQAHGREHVLCDHFGSMKLWGHDLDTKLSPIPLTNLITADAMTRSETRPRAVLFQETRRDTYAYKVNRTRCRRRRRRDRTRAFSDITSFLFFRFFFERNREPCNFANGESACLLDPDFIFFMNNLDRLIVIQRLPNRRLQSARLIIC